MKKKSILFVIHGMGVGGIETCLANLVNVIPTEQFDIDILIENAIYDMKDRIKVPVNYIETYRYILDPLESYYLIKKQGGVLRNFIWTLRYLTFRVFVKVKVRKTWIPFERLPKHYDVAIAYSQECYGPYYVIDKVNADRKVLWYHAGVYEYPDQRYKLDLKYYPQYDNIVCVSADNKKVFGNYFPATKEKLLVLQNFSDPDFIKQKATEFYPETYRNHFNIVTVGRMVEQKKPDIAVKVCKNLVEMGYDVVWHWIGEGEDREMVTRMIEEYHLEKNFILEGSHTNPYPYVYYSDIYAQTSRHEAFCTTITEAKILCKPIVATDVCGVRNQFTNGKNGLICESNVESLVDAITSLISQPQLREKFTKELSENPYQQTEYLEEYLNTVLS